MIEILGLVMGIIGTGLAIGSGCFWYTDSIAKKEIKKYAAERDFGHIKNSLLQLTTNLANDFQDIERRLDEIKADLQEIKFESRIDKK